MWGLCFSTILEVFRLLFLQLLIASIPFSLFFPLKSDLACARFLTYLFYPPCLLVSFFYIIFFSWCCTLGNFFVSVFQFTDYIFTSPFYRFTCLQLLIVSCFFYFLVMLSMPSFISLNILNKLIWYFESPNSIFCRFCGSESLLFLLTLGYSGLFP